MTSVLPTRDDDVLARGSEVVGGPAGIRVLLGDRWWNVYRVLVVVTATAALFGYASKYHCLLNGWGDGRYTHLCYSDIPVLYELRGLADGAVPYLSDLPADQVLEYPVLTGMFMYLAALLTPGTDSAAFFDINAALLLVCWLTAVLATAVAQRTRPWDAAMVAVAPGIILAGTVNWDLLAVALVAVGLALWSRGHPVGAGVMLGLATAAKFYPLLLLGPLLLLSWRTGRWSPFLRTAAAAVATWAVVNLPFIVLNAQGWARFYTFSRQRAEDFGSVWLALTTAGAGIPAEHLNTVATGLLALLCAGIAVLVWRAPVTPRVAQVMFLVVAALLVTNKVYSPQYVVWLVPLAVLARPRWRDFLIGLEGEGARGLSREAYAVTILVHLAATLWLAALVVRDVLDPSHDPVRNDGTGVSDPLAGPLAERPATASAVPPPPRAVPPLQEPAQPAG
jgi:uncharacterized membrane protein